MIAAIIFALHALFALYVFIRRKREESASEGFIGVAFILIIFSVGWAISTMITKLFFGPEGLAVWFNRDTISLTLLTLCEAYPAYLFFRGDSRTAEQQKEPKTPPDEHKPA